jgi:spore coat protein CotH
VRWTPGPAAAGSYDLAFSIPGSGESASVRLGVVEGWERPGNVPPDPAQYQEEYGLPVFHLRVGGNISSVAYTPATLTYRGHEYAVQVKHRGMRTLEFPKKSFTIDFPGERIADQALGFFGRKKLLLVTTFDDQTHVRNRLALELWQRLDPRRVTVKTASAVLYLNGDYRGVYMLSESVGGQMLAAHGLDGDGNLYQAKTHDANFGSIGHDGLPKDTWHDGYEKEEGTPLQGEPGAFDDLDAFVSFVATSDDATFAAQLANVAELDEYRDWWVLIMLAMSNDATRKNNFHYHNPLGGRWKTIAWDHGPSLGQDWVTMRTRATTSYDYGADNRLFRRLLSPPLDGGTRARLRRALDETARVSDMLARFDELVLETEAAARRDELRWLAQQRAFFGAEGRTDIGTYDDEVAYTSRWIAERWAYLATRY